jgi:general nucleoside transport system ATP-binding protein
MRPNAVRLTAAPTPPPEIEVVDMVKRFGSLVALNEISLKLEPGTFHALLGENGAGKSTLVKCIMGYYRPGNGSILVDKTERTIASPRDAHALGIGMVYQHFTLVPSMTVAENLLLARADLPHVIDRRVEMERIESFLASMPFRVDPARPAGALAAGEKQKVEIIKQLYLGSRVLILDEPTSVLTPGEADEILGLLCATAKAGRLTVLLITHKLREVISFASEVTVLRRGKVAGRGHVAEVSAATLTEMMVGTERIALPAVRAENSQGSLRLECRGLCIDDDKGHRAVSNLSLAVRAGEIVGVAGASGNGQRELVEVLAGQREPAAGEIVVHGRPYRATRDEARRERVFCLPEEPLRNACVTRMTVAENLAFRRFDQPPFVSGKYFLNRGALEGAARDLIARYRIRPPFPDLAVEALSGGNVQRLVLARELSGQVEVLVAANPCVGLDVAAIAEIRRQIMQARNRGAAVLLVSEDLDELFELADRIVVMFGGAVVHETTLASADLVTIGRYMAGH